MKLESKIPASVESFLLEVGDILIFTGQVTWQFLTSPFEYKELVRQGYYIGNKALPLTPILVVIADAIDMLGSFGRQC